MDCENVVLYLTTERKVSYIIITLITSTSDLLPSTAVANQLRGHLFSMYTYINYKAKLFIFIIALII